MQRPSNRPEADKHAQQGASSAVAIMNNEDDDFDRGPNGGRLLVFQA